MTYKIHIGSNLDILPTLPDNSVDSIVTDPPYGLSDNKFVAETLTRWINGERDFIPDGKGFMGKSWDAFVPPPALWDECLRVLKPGGHLLAFFGSRTQDIGALSIRLAGFEIRDSIAWMYGSGFPKSLDISKAIDKAAGAEREVLTQTVEDLFGERQEEKKLAQPGSTADRLAMGNGWQQAPTETAPSTPEAQQWEGWGTALKPAFEPIVVARKPLGGEIFVRARIENELKKLGVESISWTSSASGVKQLSQKLTSSSIKRPKTAETFASSVSVREPENTELKIQTSIEQLPSDSTLPIQADNESLPKNQKPNSKNKSLKPMAQTVNAAENQNEPSSHLITSMEVGQSIEEEPLAKSGTNLEGLDSQMVIESFAGIATGLSGLQATVHIQKLSNGEFLWPEGLPEVYKVGNTVAENVLTHGTGGLNIDGSRIGTTDNLNGGAYAAEGQKRNDGWGMQRGEAGEYEQPTGRWPANVILDPYTAELLDEQSGVSKSPSGSQKYTRAETAGVDWKNSKGMFTAGREWEGVNYGDTGGASRFFYVAKASKRDRNEGLEGLPKSHPVGGADKWTETDRRRGAGVTREPTANIHPTVKPTDLMRYLVKLVTPPGGTVLDPFTGSGSTGKAAILEGFDFIGIELTEDYIPIIEGRLAHAEQQYEENQQKKDEALF